MRQEEIADRSVDILVEKGAFICSAIYALMGKSTGLLFLTHKNEANNSTIA
jgi:hypothetical protein